MTAPLPHAQPLHERFLLEPAGDDRFRAALPGFGAVTLGCALLAAARSTELSLHSFHTYFLRPVPTAAPALIVLTRVRDGRRFASRRVEVRDGDKLCCELVASFAAPGKGFEHQETDEVGAVPAPESLPSEEQIAREGGWGIQHPPPLGSPIEWRFVDGTPWRAAERSLYRGWVKPRMPLPDERAFHVAALGFLADMHSHMPIARRIGERFEPFGYSSLDQVLWLHCEEPWTDWRLLTSVCDVAGGGRAFTRRTLHTRDGRLLASMAQEQLLS